MLQQCFRKTAEKTFFLTLDNTNESNHKILSYLTTNMHYNKKTELFLTWWHFCAVLEKSE